MILKELETEKYLDTILNISRLDAPIHVIIR